MFKTTIFCEGCSKFKRKALDFLTNKSVVYKMEGSDMVVVRYLKGQTDNGMNPELNTPLKLKEFFQKEYGYTGDIRKIVREIDYDDFDIQGYKDYVDEGGDLIASLQVKLNKTREQWNKLEQIKGYQSNDAARYVELSDTLRELELGDLGGIKPKPSHYRMRTMANVDNTDVTIVAFSKNNILKDTGTAKTIFYASRGKWLGDEWKKLIQNNIDKYDTGVFARSNNKPLILINLDNPQLTDDFIFAPTFFAIYLASSLEMLFNDPVKTIFL